MKVTLIANTPEPQRLIETCARISYESQNYPFDPDVNSKFIRRLIANGHESPLEHASATVLIEDVSRTCSHQIVRHRIASYSQRSGRYVQFDPARAMFVLPKSFKDVKPELLEEARNLVLKSGSLYEAMLLDGVPKEDARFLLPQAEMTSMYMTTNFREWRHFLELRLDRHAQWEIRGVAEKVLGILFGIAPDVFFDITTTTTTGENP
jgi:thymidylate synthase (FAD)